MKKMKKITAFICSAIAAFSMLALAGCDLELRGDPLDIGNIAEGTVVLADADATTTVYFYPQYGIWNVSTNGGSEEVLECAGGWWTGGARSTATALADGGTVTIIAQGTGTLTPVFEGNIGSEYYTLDMVNIGGWTTNSAGTVTVNGTSGWDFSSDLHYQFVITRSGQTLSFTFSELDY